MKSASPTPTQLVHALGKAFKASDWDGIAKLYHPDALVKTVIGGEEPRPGLAFIQLLRDTEDAQFRMPRWTAADLDEHAALVSGINQRRFEPRGFSTSPVSWVMTFRDGLLYRSAVFPTDREAKQAYARLGVDLGMPEPEIAGPHPVDFS